MPAGNVLPKRTETAPAVDLRKICANCPNPIGNRPRARFCSDACSQAFHNQSKALGAPIVRLAQAWRAARSGSREQKAIGAAALNEMCRILDLFNEHDRKEGRSTAKSIEYARRLLADGQYIDRSKLR